MTPAYPTTLVVSPVSSPLSRRATTRAAGAGRPRGEEQGGRRQEPAHRDRLGQDRAEEALGVESPRRARARVVLAPPDRAALVVVHVGGGEQKRRLGLLRADVRERLTDLAAEREARLAEADRARTRRPAAGPGGRGAAPPASARGGAPRRPTRGTAREPRAAAPGGGRRGDVAEGSAPGVGGIEGRRRAAAGVVGAEDDAGRRDLRGARRRRRRRGRSRRSRRAARSRRRPVPGSRRPRPGATARPARGARRARRRTCRRRPGATSRRHDVRILSGCLGLGRVVSSTSFRSVASADCAGELDPDRRGARGCGPVATPADVHRRDRRVGGLERRRRPPGWRCRRARRPRPGSAGTRRRARAPSPGGSPGGDGATLTVTSQAP